MSQQINLFNPIFLQQKKMFAASKMAQALGVLTLGALLIAGLAWRSVGDLRREAADVTLQAAKKQARLTSAAAEFAPRKASAALAGQLGDAETQLAALRRVAHTIQSGDLGNTHGYAGYFRALGRQHQEGLWLTGVSIGGAAADLSLQGRTLDATLVPAYIARLSHEPALQGKAFGNLQISQPLATATPAAAPERMQAAEAAAAPPAPDKPLDARAVAAYIAGLGSDSVLGNKASASQPAAPVAVTTAAPAPFLEFTLQANAVEARP